MPIFLGGRVIAGVLQSTVLPCSTVENSALTSSYTHISSGLVTQAWQCAESQGQLQQELEKLLEGDLAKCQLMAAEVLYLREQ